MIAICPWCVGWNPRDPKNKGASHVCCAACQIKLLAETA